MDDQNQNQPQAGNNPNIPNNTTQQSSTEPEQSTTMQGPQGQKIDVSSIYPNPDAITPTTTSTPEPDTSIDKNNKKGSKSKLIA
jgi:hypothetical protein